MQHLISKIEKVVINSGLGRASQLTHFQEKLLPAIMDEFAQITGQKPAPRGARKSIAGFKLREGSVIGLVATLRGKRMAAFLDKFVKIVLPRVRDFRGIDPKNIDSGGNLTIGIREHIIFPEINAEKSNVNFGLQITIVPQKTLSGEEATAFYKTIGIPFKKD